LKCQQYSNYSIIIKNVMRVFVLTHKCYGEPGYLSQYSNKATGHITGIKVSFKAEERIFFSTPQCPDQLWRLPSLPSNWYWRLFLRR
jgi:hypothetical protein